MKTELNKWEELTLANNFIFQKYMSNKDNCKKLLSEIFGKPIEKIEYHNLEQTIKEGFDSKGIRVDVYFKGDDKIYNVEMQTTKKELPKRSRYYHSMLDLSTLEAGESYNKIAESYVIFICTFDPLKKDHYLYDMATKCINVEDVEYDDGQHTIFLNTKGIYGEISDYLKSFLNAADGVFDTSAFSATIREEVEKVKANSVWREEYMFQEMHDIEMKEEGKLEAIKTLLNTKSIEDVIALGFDEELVKKAAEKQDD